MTTRAYAKINLGLRILNRRDDGYHDIETVFRRINLFDELSFEPASTISLTCNQPDLPTDGRNLCVRTTELVQKISGTHQGVHITLKKNIPVGAGLGGGSADAATVLRTLPQWWGAGLSEQQLFALALEIGADVPYFLKAGTACATGKGEILDYFALEMPYWIVVVYPNLHVSTTWAYQNVRAKSPKEKRKQATVRPSLKDILIQNINDPRMLTNLLHNDFEPLVLRAHEPVARLRQSLSVAGADFAQMSGSGSSVYGLFLEEGHARDAARELANRFQVSLTPPHFEPGM